MDVGNIATSLWPDMSELMKAGISLGVGALGFAGVFQDVPIFKFSSPVFNNIDDEIANKVANYVEI